MHTSRGLLSVSRRTTVATVALVGVTLTLLLTGCTEKPAPPGPPPTSAAPATTPSPTPTAVAAPVRPEAMNTASVDGAVAAAKYFMAVYTYARQTGDLTEWQAMSADDCQFCNGVVKTVETANSAGHVVAGAAVSVLESTGSEIEAARWYTATLRIEEAESREVDRSGSVIGSGPGSASDLTFAITFDGGTWIIDEVDIASTPSN